MKFTHLFSLGASCLYLTSVAHAAFQITQLEVAQVIDFQSNVGWNQNDSNPSDNVLKFIQDGANRRALIEHGSFAWGNDANNWGLSSEAWSLRNSNFQGNVATAFGDYNNDGDTADLVSVANAIYLRKHSTFGPNASDHGLFMSADSTSADFGSNAYSDTTIVLRIQNVTGIAINEWDITTKVWMNGENSRNNMSNFTMSYSTNNTDYTSLDSVTGAVTTGWVSQGTKGGTISASVANNDYLYVKFDNLRVNSGWGVGFALDDISVTAVPEPSTYAMILGALAAGFTLWRRRK